MGQVRIRRVIAVVFDRGSTGRQRHVCMLSAHVALFGHSTSVFTTC